MVTTAREIDVALIVPTHERANELCTLLDSLDQLDESDRLEIIVIDDGSSQPLEPIIRSKNLHWPISVLRNESAMGPSAARNRGAGATRATYLWFMDSDAEVCLANTLTALSGRLAEAPQVGAVGGIFEPFGTIWRPVRLLLWPNFLFVYLPASSADETAGPVGGLGSCNLMLRRRDFEAIGGFDETFHRDEDMDLCLRLSSRGLVIEQVSLGLVRHHISPSGRDTGKLAYFNSSRDYFRVILGTRARLLARHKPVRAVLLPLLDAILFPLMAIQILRGRYSANRITKIAASSRIKWLCAVVNEIALSYITVWKELWNRKGHKIYAQSVSI